MSEKKENKLKTRTKGNRKTILISQETKKQLAQILAQINKKEYGRRVSTDPVISLALRRISKSDIKKFQAESMSFQDEMKMEYKLFKRTNPGVSYDQYLRKRVLGEVKTSELVKPMSIEEQVTREPIPQTPKPNSA